MIDRTGPELAKPATPGAALSREISRGEKVEAELDAFISRQRSRQRDKRVREEGRTRPEEAAWRETERRYAAARQDANRRAWHEYHLARAESLRTNLRLLIAHHEAEAERYAR